MGLGTKVRKPVKMMLSHVTIGTNDLERSGKFYDAVLGSLGLIRRTVTPDGGPPALCWVSKNASLPRFYVYTPFDGQPATVGNGSMIAFIAPSPKAVSEAFMKGIENGGTSEGNPGPRDHYGQDYVGAYMRDPDGNKIHVVHRGDLIDPFNS